MKKPESNLKKLEKTVIEVVAISVDVMNALRDAIPLLPKKYHESYVAKYNNLSDRIKALK